MDKRSGPKLHPNPVRESEIGKYREGDLRVIVDARSEHHGAKDQPGGCCLAKYNLSFPEAGPRDSLLHPARDDRDDLKDDLRVGVMVSGGIAPGINAVIAGIVNRHRLYAEEQFRRWDEAHRERRPQAPGQEQAEQPQEAEVAVEEPSRYDLEVRGFRDGLSGVRRARRQDPLLLSIERGESGFQVHSAIDVKDHANQGGSVIGTSRFDTLLDLDRAGRRARQTALDALVNRLNVDILYIIGGDGSMRAAHAIGKAARRLDRDLSVVAIPKTMDNDILWVWQSFGFLSAVEKAREFALQLHTEAESNPRLCIMQLFGSDSGFVVSHAALASGVCDLALIPEVPFSLEKVSKHVIQKLYDRYNRGENENSPHGLIIMSETAIPTDYGPRVAKDAGLDEEEMQAAQAFIDNGRRVRGQTPDALRRAGLKILSHALQTGIRGRGGQFWREFRVFANEPRHLIRAINPSVQDVIAGQRLGALAVDNAMAGYTDFMISQWLTEFVLVPLELVVLGRKRVPKNGIFWKSVLASTGQPDELD